MVVFCFFWLLNFISNDDDDERTAAPSGDYNI